jgi:anti-sigma factor RsiW
VSQCPETERLQSLLDGELSPADQAAVRRHALSCAECSEELALYERVFAALAEAPTWDPGPRLTERILDQVLPSRVRRRWIRALGWGYGLAAAGSFAGVAALLGQPGVRSVGASLGAEASHRLAQTAVFVLDALAFAAVQLSGGWSVLEALVSRLAPLFRAMAALLGRPGVDLVLLTATLASGLLFWWLRPRELQVGRARSRREIEHVGLLGF